MAKHSSTSSPDPIAAARPAQTAVTAKGSLQFVVFASAVTAIGAFLFGYDTAVINGANTYLQSHFGLDPQRDSGWIGLATASAIYGCIPGSMFAGFFSDRFGRRRVLFFCALLYALSAVLSAIPQTFAQFIGARFLSGIAIGISSMICPVYIAEIAPAKWRGRLGALFQLGIVTGIFLTLFINQWIQQYGDAAWNAARGWRWMLAAEALPAFAFVLLIFPIPESPRWLRRCEKIGACMKARKMSPRFAKKSDSLLPPPGVMADFFTPSDPGRARGGSAPHPRADRRARSRHQRNRRRAGSVAAGDWDLRRAVFRTLSASVANRVCADGGCPVQRHQFHHVLFD